MYIDLPWRTCGNPWNTRYCLTSTERLEALCWAQDEDIICSTPIGNLSHALLKDPVKEFWE